MPKKTVIMTEEEASKVLSMTAYGSWIWSGVIGRRRDQELWNLYNSGNPHHLEDSKGPDNLAKHITIKRK